MTDGIHTLVMPKRAGAKATIPEQLSISYLDPKLPRATFKQALWHWLASALVYGAILLVYTVTPWFRDLLRIRLPFGKHPTLFVGYCYAYVAYLVMALAIYLAARPRSLWASKNIRIVGYFRRLIRWRFQSPKRRVPDAWRPTYEEKHSMMFVLIKIFYGPLMISSALTGYYDIAQQAQQMQFHPPLLGRLNIAYMIFFDGVFLLDSLIFTMGYHSESGFMRNKLRYAETNPLHILVCIACYPPFNMTTSALFGPSNRRPDIMFCGDLAHPMTWILRGLAMLFLLLLLSTSAALFTKSSNLTNRGIVDWGPYRIIRHPGYLAKNMFWLMTLIPSFVPNKQDPYFTWPAYALFCAMTVWGFLGWGMLYFLRSLTEEKFLMRDPDYVAYCRKVKYRFIPGVY